MSDSELCNKVEADLEQIDSRWMSTCEERKDCIIGI